MKYKTKLPRQIKSRHFLHLLKSLGRVNYIAEKNQEMSNIKCPKCDAVIDVENVLLADAELKIKLQYEKQLQQSLALVDAEKKKLEERERILEEKRKNENEIFQQKLQQEKLKLQTEIQEQVRKSVAGDFENQLKL